MDEFESNWDNECQLIFQEVTTRRKEAALEFLFSLYFEEQDPHVVGTLGSYIASTMDNWSIDEGVHVSMEDYKNPSRRSIAEWDAVWLAQVSPTPAAPDPRPRILELVGRLEGLLSQYPALARVHWGTPVGESRGEVGVHPCDAKEKMSINTVCHIRDELTYRHGALAVTPLLDAHEHAQSPSRAALLIVLRDVLIDCAAWRGWIVPGLEADPPTEGHAQGWRAWWGKAPERPVTDESATPLGAGSARDK
ncbi:MAG: hypothetical protein HZA54_17570 [Planctomycetes bacterium]|nr:hypothetical protein [Planctomycetota bacterium]